MDGDNIFNKILSTNICLFASGVAAFVYDERPM